MLEKGFCDMYTLAFVNNTVEESQKIKPLFDVFVKPTTDCAVRIVYKCILNLVCHNI